VRLSSTEDSVWEEREAAILALGAVAEGCITGLLPHLTQVCFGCLVVDIVHWP
jgi:transportin-1